MTSVLALDFGSKRIGVAASVAGFAESLTTLENNPVFVQELKKLIDERKAEKLVVGLPRNLNGDETEQSKAAREFAGRLKVELKLPVYLIDEAATSIQAEKELKQSRKPYQPGDIDQLAAAIILEDYLSNEANAEQL